MPLGHTSLWILADAGDVVAHEADEDRLGRRLTVNPILDFIPVGVAFADLVLRLADGGDNFFAVHTHDRPTVLNGFLHFGGKRVYPLYGSGPLLREIEQRRKDLL